MDAADLRTPTDLDPRGLNDAPWLLDRASAWLRARLGKEKPRPAYWLRRGMHGAQIDEITWTDKEFVLQTLGDDLSTHLGADGCTVAVGEFRAQCQAETEIAGEFAAALSALTWPEAPGREKLFVEQLLPNHQLGSGTMHLRLALPHVRLRVDLDLRLDGTVVQVTLPMHAARLEISADGLTVTGPDALGWSWTPMTGRPQPQPRTVLRVTNQSGEATHEAWQQAARQRGLQPLGPFSAQIDLRDDGLRVLWMEASVLSEPDPAPLNGVQVLAWRSTPTQQLLKSTRELLPATLKRTLKPGCYIVQLLGPQVQARRGIQRAELTEFVNIIRQCP